MDLFITPELNYIESEANPANPISHREPGPARKQIVLAFMLPEELAVCFVDVWSQLQTLIHTCRQEVCGWGKFFKFYLSTPHSSSKFFSPISVWKSGLVRFFDAQGL